MFTVNWAHLAQTTHDQGKVSSKNCLVSLENLLIPVTSSQYNRNLQPCEGCVISCSKWATEHFCPEFKDENILLNNRQQHLSGQQTKILTSFHTASSFEDQFAPRADYIQPTGGTTCWSVGVSVHSMCFSLVDSKLSIYKAAESFFKWMLHRQNELNS